MCGIESKTIRLVANQPAPIQGANEFDVIMTRAASAVRICPGLVYDQSVGLKLCTEAAAVNNPITSSIGQIPNRLAHAGGWIDQQLAERLDQRSSTE